MTVGDIGTIGQNAGSVAPIWGGVFVLYALVRNSLRLCLLHDITHESERDIASP